MCDQSPHQLQSYYSFEWELGVPVFVSRARDRAAVPDIFCPGTLWGKFTAICQGFAHIKFNCNISVVDPNCVSLLFHSGT